ncbi:MAG: helix-turn-helix domain-containing protein [Lachnospiraceae bacterium]|nr:helix-turn-helix domain-containing protein [Lachnospiraceae bacterium]MCM1227675.1 helix-turn-helix domain-containing protein [Clostridium sp.]
MNLSDQEIGKKIKQYRKGKMTQQELAAKIGKTESSIRKYEKGLVTIPLDVLEAIASTLGITAFDLMGAEYWDKKYPDIAKESKEYEGFIDYLNALGYAVKDIYSPSQIPIEEFEKAGAVPAESHCLELTKDEKSFILEDDEFSDMLKDTKDMIALKLWQKSQEQK